MQGNFYDEVPLAAGVGVAEAEAEAATLAAAIAETLGAAGAAAPAVVLGVPERDPRAAALAWLDLPRVWRLA